jgi:pSer/pThr/pTyr-binding forkhead associated (FHA) protein
MERQLGCPSESEVGLSSFFVLRGKDQGQRFYLNLPMVRIGRDRENDICLHDSEVSRKHAQVILQSGRFVFHDLGSANGSVINQERTKERVLYFEGGTSAFGSRTRSHVNQRQGR